MNRFFLYVGFMTMAAVGSIGADPLAAPNTLTPPPPLASFATIKADSIGQRLESSLIWNGSTITDTKAVTPAFRKKFNLDKVPPKAVLHIFADARYILWVNGRYVERGPARFQPNGPEYDSVDVTAELKPGENTVAILVVGNLSGGKIMRHEPGLTAILEADGQEIIRTDASWKWTQKTRYRQVTASWPTITDAVIDTRLEDGDWRLPAYDDSAWQPAVGIASQSWGHLTARRIPLLRETSVPFTFGGNASLPVTLQAGQKLEFTTGRIVQVYPEIEFTADEGTELELKPFGVAYYAKSGPQSYFTIDTRGITQGEIGVTKGSITLTGFKLIERLYPYDQLGAFKSSDDFLNQLWAMCARSCEVLSEDSYVDCADRERVEWMDDDPPGFDITRTVMAGPAGADGKPVYSDPRLLGEMIRRTALTLQPDGWVKAHTCSDRYDKHAKMEDRACDWIEGIRRYYEATGNVERVQEIWPAVTAQMDYFLKRRTDKGLVSARDWVVWGNPLGYATGETTTLNAFVYRALADSAYLAQVTGHGDDATRFAQAAADLDRAINTVLWDEEANCYYSGYFGQGETTKALPIINGLTAPTLHGNLFALDQGVVPPERRAKVMAAVLAEVDGPKKNIGGNGIMTAYYIFKQLYALDQTVYDQQVLDLLRTRWKAMVASPWVCSWEGFTGGSHAHIYGMYPGYFLSAYVLGVRRDAPVADRKLLIEPHLGDLQNAEGTVVTEFGPIPVSWQRGNGHLNFTVTAPPNVETTLALPTSSGEDTEIDGKPVTGEIAGARQLVVLSPGAHQGSCPDGAR